MFKFVVLIISILLEKQIIFLGKETRTKGEKKNKNKNKKPESNKPIDISF